MAAAGGAADVAANVGAAAWENRGRPGHIYRSAVRADSPGSRSAHWRVLLPRLMSLFRADTFVASPSPVVVLNAGGGAAAAAPAGAYGAAPVVGAAGHDSDLDSPEAQPSAAGYPSHVGAQRFMRAGVCRPWFLFGAHALGDHESPLRAFCKGPYRSDPSGTSFAASFAAVPPAGTPQSAAAHRAADPYGGFWQGLHVGGNRLAGVLWLVACLYFCVLGGGVFPTNAIPAWQQADFDATVSYYLAACEHAVGREVVQAACYVLFPLCMRKLPRSAALRLGTFDRSQHWSPCVEHTLLRGRKRGGGRYSVPAGLRNAGAAPADRVLQRDVGFYAKAEGYVMMGLLRRVRGVGWEYAHRVLCYLVHGPPPEYGDGKKMEAIHLCENKSCLNPLHIIWAEHRENMNVALYRDAWRRAYGGSLEQADALMGLTDTAQPPLDQRPMV